MSATIATNDLSFVIFASGHDYTLADSGDGDVQIFSHPFVPLNSVNYAGQYFFLVPDENGDPIDAVMDDIAHCTFTPALGTAFDTEGETTVECHYHREYIYDEETLVVDKTVSQTITVVNHGSVYSSNTYCDLYSDGYAFYRPSSVNTAGYLQLRGNGQPAKVSSIPWRVTVLGDSGNDFLNCFNVTDISELQYADTSNVVHIQGLFRGAGNLSVEKAKEAVGEWNLSNLQSIYQMAVYSSCFSDLSFMEKWNTPNLVSLSEAFTSMKNVTSLHGLEHLDVSNVTSLSQTFDDMSSLTDISAISGWNVEKVTTMFNCFNNTRMSNLDALVGWKPTSLTSMRTAFRNMPNLLNVDGLITWSPQLTDITECFYLDYALVDIRGVANLDVSGVTAFDRVFAENGRLKTLDGLETWNVSNGASFIGTFNGDRWLEDISALATWDFSSSADVHEMFYNAVSIFAFDDVTAWSFPSGANMTHMFYASLMRSYSTYLGIDLVSNAFYYFDYDGRQYTHAEVANEDNPLTYPTYDATGATNWTTGTSKDSFDTPWTNIPAWN